MTELLNDTRLVITGDGEPIETTWAEFVAENYDGDGTVDEARDGLRAHGFVTFGGGAAVEKTVSLASYVNARGPILPPDFFEDTAPDDDDIETLVLAARMMRDCWKNGNPGSAIDALTAALVPFADR